jgi:aspartate-semialdehyde dehydrogenase
MRVAVVGATGAVGSIMLDVLRERGFPATEVVPFASERSVGREIRSGDQTMTVQGLSKESIQGFYIAIFSAGGSTSGEWAPRFAEAGDEAIDNSSRWRMEEDVPLVVAEVNPEALDSHRGIVANPNCTTMVAALPLKALHDGFGLLGFVATSFQAAGGAGQKGIDELRDQVSPLVERWDLLRDDGAAALKALEPEVHANVLAFNIVPLLGVLDEHGYTDEEMKLQNESRKILGLPDLMVAPTCIRVPVAVGHSLQIRATFEDRVTAADALSSMDGFPGLILDHAPTPLEWAGRWEVAVGRVRSDLVDPHSLNFWVTGDNLLKGAALNTLQIGEVLLERGVVGG